MTELQRRFIFPIKLNTKSSINRKLVCPCIQYLCNQSGLDPFDVRSRSNVSGSKRPVAACVRLHARFSARMNILKRNLNTACTTGQTVACDQCRIKVFGGLRLYTYGPLPPYSLPWFPTHIATPVYHLQENVKLQMTVGIRVLLVELNVQLYNNNNKFTYKQRSLKTLRRAAGIKCHSVLRNRCVFRCRAKVAGSSDERRRSHMVPGVQDEFATFARTTSEQPTWRAKNSNLLKNFAITTINS